MMTDEGKKHLQKRGFIYSVLVALFTSLLLMFYIVGDVTAQSLDATGWVFFLTSCLSHAGLVVLALWAVVFLPLVAAGLRRLPVGLLVGLSSLLAILVFVNMQVYKIYRFHINGFIVNMLMGPNAGDIFDFDTKLYISEGLMLGGLLVSCIGLWWASSWLARRSRPWHLKTAVGAWLAALVVANGIHVYGAFVAKPSVLQCVRIVPYYFPLSASSLMQKMGFERHTLSVSGMSGEGELNYPLHPLHADTALAQRPNVVFILIDSWSRRALTEECMPQLYRLAHEEQWYQNHVSCSNGTRFAVFGLFTGLQPYYWTAFEASRTSPLLIEQLLSEGYDFRAYPSASLQNPPFHRMLFQHVPQLRTETPGSSAYERDQRIKADLMADLPQLKAAGRPFFSFIFFDLLHAYSLPKELLTRFQPSWEYGDFARLKNDMDPTPFWNLYRNSAYQTDQMVGQLIGELKRLGMYDNTLVVITGDHAQEYNENHKNYWGHNSNFSQYQIGVPLIVHEPGRDTAAVYRHRTTHYDFVPTLMHNYLGVTNPLDDYSAGLLLNDTTPRLWHFVGNELRYAFLVEGDTILTKEGAGYVEVTDAQLNPVGNYRVQPKRFNQAIGRLNRFFK